MLRLARFGVVVAVGILGVVHGASIRSAEDGDFLGDSSLVAEGDGFGSPDFEDTSVPVAEGPLAITEEVAADESLLDTLALGDEAEALEEGGEEFEAADDGSEPGSELLALPVGEAALTMAEEVTAEEPQVDAVALGGGPETVVEPVAQEERVEALDSAEDPAPVGVLDLPDDIIPDAEESDLFYAASAEETFEAASLYDPFVASTTQAACPPGYQRQSDLLQSDCKKPRGNVDGYAFIDDNMNLNMEEGEIGLPGILLTISNKAATFRASVRTDSTGHYQIKNLPPGTYYLTVDLSSTPPGLTAVHDQVTIAIQPFTNSRQDFPFQGAAALAIQASASIGPAHVFIDVNGNRVFDGSDTPVPGVLVRLTSYSTGQVSSTVLTDERGQYVFSQLGAGLYTVQIDTATIPAGTTPIRNSFTVTLAEGEEFVDGAFGLDPPAPTASIGPNTVFVDSYKNSWQDSSEQGVPNAVVRLMKNGRLVLTKVTDAQGTFFFNSLAAGSYVVQLDLASLPALYVSVRPEGQIAVTLGQGQSFTNADFPVLAPAKGNVGVSKVFSDLNNNGVQDSAEPGVSNILVNLVDATGTVVASTRSDRNGNFKFDQVLVGSYRVEVDQRSVPSKYLLTSPSPATVVVTEGSTSTGVTIRALTNYATIGPAAAFVDANGSNVQDATEPGVPGVTVMLLGQSKIIQTTKTDQSGKYTFSNIQPGVYVVRVDRATIPYGLATIKTDGEYTITLTPSQTATGQLVDIPFKKLVLARIRGVIKNGNTPIPNVKISALDSAGDHMMDFITSATGIYSFTNLPAGVYNLQIDPSTLPTGIIPADKKTGKVAATVKWGDSLTVNFKYKSAYGIFGPGVVFVDANKNSIYDAGEVSLSRVTIDLMRANGKVVATAKTDASGRYQFNHVAPGTYEVRVVESTVPPLYALQRVSYTAKLRAAQQITGADASFPVARL